MLGPATLCYPNPGPANLADQWVAAVKALWRERMGFDPIIYLDSNAHQRKTLLKDIVREIG
jgi:hypothetical protein